MRTSSRIITHVAVSVLCGLLLPANPARAQNALDDPGFPTADTVVRRIYREGMQHSRKRSTFTY